MTTVDEWYERLVAFNPIEAAKVIMEESREEILDLNRTQLFEKGIDENGNPLPEYSRASIHSGYVERKNNPRLLGGDDSYDLKNTGATYESLTLDFEGDDYSITPHTDYAEKAAGPLAFGLTQESKDIYWAETLQTGMVEAIAEKVGCTVI